MKTSISGISCTSKVAEGSQKSASANYDLIDRRKSWDPRGLRSEHDRGQNKSLCQAILGFIKTWPAAKNLLSFLSFQRMKTKEICNWEKKTVFKKSFEGWTKQKQKAFCDRACHWSLNPYPFPSDFSLKSNIAR